MDMIVLGSIIFVMAAVAVYSVLMQRRAVKTQNSAVSQSLPAQQEGLILMRENVELQREANRLLAVMTKAIERQ